MKQENPISEANLKEHFGDSGYHVVNAREEPLPEEEGIMVSEVHEPFATDRLAQEDESPVDEYLERVNEKFYKQPKVRFIDYLPATNLNEESGQGSNT